MSFAEIRQRLFDPVDVAGLAVFRVIFGALMCWDACRYVMLGWVGTHYVAPQLNLKFVGFEWVATLPGPVMYAVFGVMVASAAAICIGAYYRLSCALFFLAHTYVFLVAAEYYLNHAYLISTLSFLMIFVPAHRALSIDVTRVEGLYSRKVPRWAYLLPMAMMGTVYFYGAIAKMNADWLSGEPVRHWLAHRADTVAFAAVERLLRSEFATMFVSYNGVLFDLLVVPLLLWKRTRAFAVIATLGFHLSNHYLFNIGVFPWFSLAMTTLFFDPSWPRHPKPVAIFGPAGEAVSDKLDEVGAPSAQQDEEDDERDGAPASDPPWVRPPVAQQRRIAALLAAVVGLHVLLPLRHHLYPGEVAWNEEGHMYSWRMKLRNKRGRFTLRVVDKATGKSWVINPHDQLDDRQYRKAATRPDLLLNYVHYLRDAYRRDMGMDVSIHADAFVSLNYRPERRFIDPETDLAAVEPAIFAHYDWVTDFRDDPLPSPVRELRPGLGPLANRLRLVLSASRARPG